MSTLAAQKETTQVILDAYNAWDPEAILASRAPDCQQQVLPLTMRGLPMSNAEYRTRLEMMLPWFRNFTVTVHTTVHDADAHTCMMHATSTADTDIGPYENEYALILHFAEDGRKVVKILEFVDSAYSMEFFERLAEAGFGK